MVQYLSLVYLILNFCIEVINYIILIRYWFQLKIRAVTKAIIVYIISQLHLLMLKVMYRLYF